MNSGAYISEIIRAGILAVDKGQMEAAKSLGVPYLKAMKDIVLPQAIRKILPSLVNESIDLLKESALISVISGQDILYRAKAVAAEKYTYFEPLIIAGILYYVMVYDPCIRCEVAREKVEVAMIKLREHYQVI